MALAQKTSAPATPSAGNPSTQRSDGQWAIIWRRLRKNTLAMGGLVVLILFVLMALGAPLITSQDPTAFHGGQTQLPPVWVAESPAKDKPNPEFIFGTDNGARDVFSRVVYGARTSVFVGIIPTLIIMVIGVTVGMSTGFFGGWLDNILMRVVDILEAFPDILFYIVLTVALRETAFGNAANGLLLLFFALAVVSWGGLSRLVRGTTLTIRNQEYIDAARSLGASNFQILFKHILPNALGIIVVWAALAMPRMIIAEATLAYLGLGMKPVSSMSDSYFLTSWGQIISEGRSSLNAQPWILLTASICIALIVVAVTFFGNGLRDAVDPRMKK
ncbi:MAG: ABC transporter permease [Dermatophilaceae bacterium]